MPFPQIVGTFHSWYKVYRMRTSHSNPIFYLIISALLCILPLSCGGGRENLDSRTEYLLGTTCTISLPPGTEDEVFTDVFAAVKDIEERMSTKTPGSEISQLNRMAGVKPVLVSKDTFSVIQEAVEFFRLSRGTFDITVGPLVNLWKIGTPEAAVPGPEAILEVLPLIDTEKIRLDRDTGTVFLEKEGMAVDLGGIAKGYAADVVVRILKDKGVERGIIDLGGNIYALGSKKGGTEWRIGIQNPEGERGTFIGIIPTVNRAVVTSGVYERYFIERGVRYHHILDTVTGYPVANGTLSVTVVSPSSIMADAASTALFALGSEEGIKLVESLPQMEALFVLEGDKVILSSGLKEKFSLTDSSFAIEGTN